MQNEAVNPHCLECGVAFQGDSSPIPADRLSLSLLPHSAAEWTRSVAFPLFVACVVILAWALGEGYGHNRVWHYAGPAITNRLLPFLGAALGLTCLVGKGLQRGFRVFALIVALLAVVGGILAPSLAE